MGRTIPVIALFIGTCLCGWSSARSAPAEASAAAPQTCAAMARTVPTDADKALARGQFAEAGRLFAAMPPSDASLAGQIRVRLGQGQPALALALQAVAAHPQSAMLADALADVRLFRGEPVEALANLRRAIELDPCLARAHYDLSLYLDLSSMAASAQRELETAYRLQPTDALIRRDWKTSQLPVPTPESDIADMRRIEALPGETAAQKAEIEGLIKTFEADSKGDCERISPSPATTIPLVPLFADGKQRPATATAVELVLNGKKRQLLMDTGATGMVLSYEAALGLGLVPEADVTSSGVGDGGESREYVAHLASMKIGGLEFRNCKVRVQRAPHGLAVPGLFGADTLRSLLLTFDFPRQELRTAALPPLTVTAARDAQPTAAAAKRDRSVPPGLEGWTPVLREEQSLLVPATIGAAPQKVFILDTGMQETLVTTDLAREVSTLTRRPGDSLRGVSGVARDLSVTGPVTLALSGFNGRIGEMTAMDDLSGFAPRGIVQVPGFIGYDVLRGVVMSIDYRDGLVQVQNVSGAP